MSREIHNSAAFPNTDVEKGSNMSPAPLPEDEAKEVPPLKGLSLLDRFLVVWIILAMAVGILLGNFVPSTGPALQRGEFVGVSIPIGTFPEELRSYLNTSD
jgi:ACR3 family arsenite transporter